MLSCIRLAPVRLFSFCLVSLLVACGGGGGGSGSVTLTAPANLAAVPTSSTGITLSWSAASGATGYHVYRSTTAGQATSAMTQLSTNQAGLAYSDAVLAPSSTYYYKVTSVSANGETATSTEVSATTSAAASSAPGAPSGLSASATSSTTISLSWTASADATTYDIYRATSPGQSLGAMTLIAADLAATSHDDTALNASTTYYYQVVAKNTAGSSAASTEASATTDAPPVTAPATPANVIGSQISGTSDQGRLTWDAATGATGYDIYRATTSGLDITDMSKVSANQAGTEFIDSGLSASTTYYYKVVALNSNGNSAASVEVAISITPVTPPPAPTLNASYSATSSSVTLSWTGLQATAFDIYLSTVSGQGTSSMTLAAADVAASPYEVTGLAASTAYYFKVVGKNAGGDGQASNEVNAYTLPAASFTVTATPTSASGIHLSWSAIGGASGYNVFRHTASGVTPTPTYLISNAQSATTFDDSGLSASTTYYYLVVASVASSSVNSAEASATTDAPGPTPPSAATGLNVTAQYLKSLTVSWSGVSGATGYDVYRATSSGLAAAAMTLVSSDQAAATFVDTGLGDNTAYYYKVVARNAAGAGPESAETNGTTLTPISGLMGGAIQGTPLTIADNSGVASTVAGDGSAGFTDNTGTAAQFNAPHGIASDGTNLYVADASNHSIRQIVIATGDVTTLAGDGTSGYADGTGSSARFNNPSGITTDGYNLFVADTGNNRIRRIELATGTVTTLAGQSFAGLIDGTSTAAAFRAPEGITTDGINLYVADTNNHSIRKIVIATGAVTTLAGTGSSGFLDDATGTLAQFYSPSAITTDGTTLYVADTTNYLIRTVDIATGTVATLAGDSASAPPAIPGLPTAAMADGTGTAAVFFLPSGITCDGSNLFVADSYNNAIRKIVISSAAVTTLATGFSNVNYGITTNGAVLYQTTVSGPNYPGDTGGHVVQRIQ